MYQHLPAQCVPSLLLGLIVNQSRSAALLISMYLISACSSCGGVAPPMQDVQWRPGGRQKQGKGS